MLFSSCDEEPGSKHPTTPPPPEPTQRHLLFITKEHAVTATEMQGIRDGFANNFGYIDATGHFTSPLPERHVAIEWDSFRQAMDRLAPIPPDIRGAMFHYGLLPNGVFTVSMTLLPMMYDSGSGEYDFNVDDPSAIYFELRADSGKNYLVRKTPADRDAWVNAGPGKDYWDHVRRVPYHVGDMLDANCDAKAYTLPFDGELAYLFAHNQDAAGALREVVISCTGESDAIDTCPAIYRHHISIVFRVDGQEQLNNTVDPTFKFWRKGADLGSPCPPRCRKFMFN